MYAEFEKLTFKDVHPEVNLKHIQFPVADNFRPREFCSRYL